MEQIMIKLALGYILMMSLIGFVLMWMDKRKAVKKAWRIPERTLILIAFLGGGLGSCLGMYTFRHKTKHGKFVISLPLCAAAYGMIAAKLLGLY